MQVYWEKLKEIRKTSGLSISYIVQKMNISRKTYWMWENGTRIPNESNIRNLAKVLSIEIPLLSDLKPEAPVSKDSPDKTLSSALTTPDSLYSNIVQSAYKLNTQLKQSQTIVKAFLNSVKVLLYIKDLKLNYVKVNDYFKEVYALEEDYCKGKTDTAFFSASEALKNTEEDQKVITTGEIIQNVENYIPGTRKKKWGLISKYPLYDSESKMQGVVGTFVDITDLKNSEQKNTLLKEVIDQINECIWIATLEPEEELQYVNNSVVEYFGYTKEEIFSNQYIYLEAIVPEEREKYESFLKSKIYPKTIEYKVRRVNDSAELILRETAYLNMGVNFCIIKDITLEKKHQELMDLLKFMIDTFTESLVLVNLSTRKYLYINNAREKLYERNSEEFYNNDLDYWINHCVHPEDKESIAFLISEAKVDKPLFYKLRIVTPSGEIKFIMQKTTFKKINGQLYALSIDYLAEEQKYL